MLHACVSLPLRLRGVGLQGGTQAKREAAYEKAGLVGGFAGDCAAKARKLSDYYSNRGGAPCLHYLGEDY